MKTKSFKSSLLLFLAAFIWGVAFVAQSVGMDYVGPFTFNAVRCFVGSLVLIPVIFWNQKRTAKKLTKILCMTDQKRAFLEVSPVVFCFLLRLLCNKSEFYILQSEKPDLLPHFIS